MLLFLEKFLGLEWLGDVAKKLNGNKTLLGFAALVIHMLGVVPTYLPEYGFTIDMAGYIQQALEWLGVLFPLGVAHKGAKALVNK